MDQLTFWSEARHASHSASLGSDEGLMIREVISCSSISQLLGTFARLGSFGKMCPEYYPAMADAISDHSSRAWPNSGMGSLTGCLTLSSSEFPSDADVSSLLGILETGDLPQRYFLSAKACKGLIRRQERRPCLFVSQPEGREVSMIEKLTLLMSMAESDT